MNFDPTELFRKKTLERWQMGEGFKLYIRLGRCGVASSCQSKHVCICKVYAYTHSRLSQSIYTHIHIYIYTRTRVWIHMLARFMFVYPSTNRSIGSQFMGKKT